MPTHADFTVPFGIVVGRTEYERLLDEKRKIEEFLETVSEEMERARAALKAGSEWEIRARKRLADIETRLAAIHGA